LFAVALTPEPHLSVHRIDTDTGAVLGSHASALGPISGEAHWKLYLSNIVLHPSGLYALMIEPLTGGYQLHLIRIDLASLSINHSPLGSAFGEDEDHRLTLVSTDEAL